MFNMNHIYSFSNFINEQGPRMRPRKNEEGDDDKDVYAFFTKELKDRKSNQKITSYTHDAYHIRFNSKKELEDLKKKYCIGAKYNGETITSTHLLNSKTFSI